MQVPPLNNPFPGLRPFEPDEDHLFFGREKETDDLLRRLRSNRFLSVVGTSGSGKSSLVRSGLIPSLQSGFMVQAGSSWRVSTLRPGEDPIGHLAEALDVPDVIGAREEDLASTNRVLVEASLRRGSLGLVEAVRFARMPPSDNLLILVDQFEELFRFQRSRQVQNARDEAVAFVKLLLEAAGQNEIPIYIVLTMRSDFIGDCMDYPGLPEAVNQGQYLVPRMTRDELRSAITGPVSVAGGEIAPRLVVRLLNDVGDNHDQLPLVQHVLMRSWDHWVQHREGNEPIDLVDYEAVGTLKNALSLHAEEAYVETGTDERKLTTERIFKALTDTYSDPRGVRRPTSIGELAAICEVPDSTVIEIIEVFRRSGRSFVMPPPPTALTSRVIVDLSHESLMRCWTRLITWAQEERLSAALYVRLLREASWFQEGAAGLWTDPELELGLRWKRQNHPSAAWARRFDGSFDLALQFLDRSEQERTRLTAERRAQRVKNLELAWGTAGVLLALLVAATLAASIARRERGRAEANLRLANDAVDQMLATTDRTSRVEAEPPEMQKFQRELLERAKGFYLQFVNQEPKNEEFLTQMANAHFRLGRIDRMLEDPQAAAREYREAITLFGSLVQNHPTNLQDQQALANAYDDLGETLRPLSGGSAEALKAYQSALQLERTLTEKDSTNAAFKEDLARTFDNRGILYSNNAAPGDNAFNSADADFREAIRLLEPLTRQQATSLRSQSLARVYNNLANLLSLDPDRMRDARPLYERAISIHEDLHANDPFNRQYQLELAEFSDNLAELNREMGDPASALRHNSRGLELIEELVRATPSLAIEQADAHDLRGRILQSGRSGEAVGEYRQSLELFTDLLNDSSVAKRADLHLRFTDLLLNLASFCHEQPQNGDARRVLADAFSSYVAVWKRLGAAGATIESKTVLDNLRRLMSALSERDRQALLGFHPDLQQLFNNRAR